MASPGVVKSRPAETGGIAAAVALLVAHAAGVDDPSVVVALALVVGFIPAAITWAVTLARGRTTP